MGDGGIAEALAGGGNALVVGHDADEDVCLAGRTVSDPAGALLLGVTVDGDAAALLDAWGRSVGTGPARATCILAGEDVRGGSAEGLVTGDAGTTLVVDTVPDPGDVSTLGTRITRHLADWDHLDGALVVRLDSLTALLEHVDAASAYRFLALLTRQIEREGGVAHYHVDPTAVDAEVLATLRPLFDVEVAVAADGEWTVRAIR